jgi:hypothetical protein
MGRGEIKVVASFATEKLIRADISQCSIVFAFDHGQLQHPDKTAYRRNGPVSLILLFLL